MKRPAQDYILPIAAFTLSVIHLIFNTSTDEYLSMLVSITGIACGIFFFAKPKYFFRLINIWIIAQLPYIVRVYTLGEAGELTEQVNPYLAPWQTIKIAFGLNYPRDDGRFQVYLNIMPFIYFVLLHLLHKSFSSNREVVLESFRDDNLFEKQLPLKGKIISTHKAGNDLWFNIQLEKPLTEGDRQYPAVLARPKGNKRFKIYKEYISHLRLVSNPDKLEQKIEDIEEYDFVDWFIIK